MIVSSPPLFIGITGILGKYFKRLPFIFEVRDIWPKSAIDLGIIKNKLIIRLSYWLENILYKVSDYNVVLTPAFKDYLINEKKIDEEKVSIITNAADLDVFFPIDKIKEEVKREYEGKFVITYFGSHSTANKIDLLLKVAKELIDYNDIIFLLIGSGKEKQNLIDYAKKNNLSNVVFKEPMSRHDLNEFANISNICTTILPNIEIFKTVYPSKLFDYMALGKPILIGFDGVAKDLVEQHEIGLYANVENIEEFKEAILTFYKNPELCKKMSKKSRLVAEQYFNREIIANDYLKFLETLKNKMN